MLTLPLHSLLAQGHVTIIIPNTEFGPFIATALDNVTLLPPSFDPSLDLAVTAAGR